MLVRWVAVLRRPVRGRPLWPQPGILGAVPRDPPPPGGPPLGGGGLPAQTADNTTGEDKSGNFMIAPSDLSNERIMSAVTADGLIGQSRSRTHSGVRRSGACATAAASATGWVAQRGVADRCATICHRDAVTVHCQPTDRTVLIASLSAAPHPFGCLLPALPDTPQQEASRARVRTDAGGLAGT